MGKFVARLNCDAGAFFVAGTTTHDVFITPPLLTAETFAEFASKYVQAANGYCEAFWWQEFAEKPTYVYELTSQRIADYGNMIRKLENGESISEADGKALVIFESFLDFALAGSTRYKRELRGFEGDSKIAELGLHHVFDSSYSVSDLLAVAQYSEVTSQGIQELGVRVILRKLYGWYLKEVATMAHLYGDKMWSPVDLVWHVAVKGLRHGETVSPGTRSCWERPVENQVAPAGVIDSLTDLFPHGVVKVVTDDWEYFSATTWLGPDFTTPPLTSVEAFAARMSMHPDCYISVSGTYEQWLEFVRNHAQVIELRRADILHLTRLLAELKCGNDLSVEDKQRIKLLRVFLDGTVNPGHNKYSVISDEMQQAAAKRLNLFSFAISAWDGNECLVDAENAATRNFVYSRYSSEGLSVLRKFYGWYLTELVKLAGIAGEHKRSPIECMQFFYQKRLDAEKEAFCKAGYPE